MSANNSASEGNQEKALSETTVQTVPQNLTTIQSIQTVQSIQNVQNAGPSNIQSIQAAQAITGQAASLVGKSISLELNSKLLMKPSIPANIGTSSENSKITTSTFCPVGSTVRIIAPNMLSTIERQSQSQVQQANQQTQQIVTSIPSTYHVPRGPAAVANISTPRATVATPLVRTINTGQPIPISRTNFRASSPSVYNEPKLHRPQVYYNKYPASTKGSKPSSIAIDLRKQSTSKIRVNTTAASTAQWQPKTTSVVYATQPQRHPVPVVNRQPTRPVATAVYTGQQQPQPQQQQQSQQQQPRLMTPSQVGVGRPVQATVVTATPSRLIAPILQAQNNITRLPTPVRPPTPQVVTSIPQVSQAAGRSVAQTIQPNQASRPLVSAPINRIAVSAPVIGAPNRVATVTSVQTNVGRQLTINTAAGTSTGTVSRIVIPQQAIQQQQHQQQQQQGGTRVVQTVSSLANFSQVSRVIATTSTNPAVAANVTRVAQTGPTSVTRITGMSLHPLPLTPTRAASTPLKITAQAPGIQTVQLKQASTTMQPQPQPQQQQQQQQGPTLQRTISSVNNASSTVTSVSNQQPAQIQGQYLHPPHTTAFYSIETSGGYSQYRPTTVQPVRLLVEQGFEEPLGKPNASPRPSILRKREHDNSPGKGVAKNLVPVLATIPVHHQIHSPPGSPKGDRDNGGHHSSGSTTVSATSSPGLDEEPEQSRITINPTVEMSPRKKPRKQQLTGVELTESRCHDEEMQFITEEKIKNVKDVKEEKEKYGERKSNNSNIQQDLKPPQQPAIKPKPTCSMIDSSWKKNGSRHQHFKRQTDVKPKEERRPTISEIAGQPHVFQKVDGWKIHHLTSQMEDVAENENAVCDSMGSRLEKMESIPKEDHDKPTIEKINELMKGIMQRNRLVAEGMDEAKGNLHGIFEHKVPVKGILQSNSGNKRTHKKR